MNIFDELSIFPRPDVTLAFQLRQQLTWLIANGKLKTGDQLPPVKVMAERLGINLHTVRSAYLKMASDGMVETRQGRGTHILPFDALRLAQSAGTFRSHTIGVIVPSWSNPFYQTLLQGIEQIAEEDQTLLFLCNTHDDLNLALRDFARLAAKQVDGILIGSTDFYRVVESFSQVDRNFNSLPVVSIDWPGCKGFSVNIDLELAGYQAAEHLIAHGHRKIGLITFNIDGENVTPINNGYLRALREHGISLDPAFIERVSGYDMPAGARGAKKLLELVDPPTAIFAISDLLCLGAFQVIKQANLQIPNDIALIGFDDIPASSLVEPTLTTVAPPSEQIGREAMKMLLLLIAGEQPPRRQMILSTTLIKRESCGCPRKEI
jgi:DNA-binding LacI/PurR family transcriptional regulator